MAEPKPHDKKNREPSDESETDERPPGPPDDKVDEASWESFPASDPPSFTPEKSS